MATGNASDAQSIYRFWSNPKVSAEAIVNSHAEETASRALACQTVLAIQDTTDLNYTSHRKTKGLGYLNQTKQQGIKVHSCFAVSGEGVPLGLLHQHCWVRPEAPQKKKKGEKKAPKKQGGKKPNQQKQPIETKESYRWLSTLKTVEAKIAPTVQLVQVADREADIFELFAQPRQAHSELLIRAKVNRKVNHELGKLFATLKQAPVLGEMMVHVERTPKRPARDAHLEVRGLQITLEVPKHLAKQPQLQLSPVTLKALLVAEIEPPADGGQPICWRLLTSLPMDSFAQAAQIIRWYSYRWLIERFHFTLKSGCKVEELQLQQRDRLLKALATYSIVAWRLMSMTYQARLNPEASCEVLLEPAEWRLLRRKFVPKSRSKKPPTLRQAMLWIAQLGGFLARKGDGEPGVKTLWRGYTKLHHLLEGAQLVSRR